MGSIKDGRKNRREMASVALSTAMEALQGVEDLRSVLGVGSRRLSPDSEDILELQAKIKEATIETRDYTSREIREWARVFFGVTEDYFRTVAEVVQTKEPWKPFFVLAGKLSYDTPRDKLISDRMLTAAYLLLEESRKYLRQVSYFYIRFQDGQAKADKKLPNTEADFDEVLINLLSL